jgi:hypothetical protein
MNIFIMTGYANNDVCVFGLTQSGLKPTIYHTGGKHANYYTTDAVDSLLKVVVISV